MPKGERVGKPVIGLLSQQRCRFRIRSIDVQQIEVASMIFIGILLHHFIVQSLEELRILGLEPLQLSHVCVQSSNSLTPHTTSVVIAKEFVVLTSSWLPARRYSRLIWGSMVMKTSDAMIGLNYLSAELDKYIDDTIRAFPAPMIDIP